MSLLGGRLLAVHDALDAARFAHAFGGAIALAYCTEEPRGTRDIDVNVFVSPLRSEAVVDALPAGVVATNVDRAALARDGQVRLWWEETPVDLFLDVHEFHHDVAREIREVPFEGRTIPVLGCHALAVFKVMFGRTKDWADIEAMIDVGALDTDRALGTLVRLLGADDDATERFVRIVNHDERRK